MVASICSDRVFPEPFPLGLLAVAHFLEREIIFLLMADEDLSFLEKRILEHFLLGLNQDRSQRLSESAQRFSGTDAEAKFGGLAATDNWVHRRRCIALTPNRIESAGVANQRRRFGEAWTYCGKSRDIAVTRSHDNKTRAG